jgi:hypothetical protein
MPQAANAMSTTQPAVTSQSATAVAAKSPNNTPIIVGIVCGIVAASVVTTLVWFFLRRRRSQKNGIRSITTFDSKEGKGYAHARQNSDYEGTHLRPGDERGTLFKCMVGCNMLTIIGYNTPSEQPSSRSVTPLDEEVDARRSLPSQVAVPEVEKKTKVPTQTHPAYHPLPGRSPDTPTWQSQMPKTPMTPVSPYTPQQTQHPAYHVHKIAQHPAFNPRNSPTRTQPQQPPMWKHPAFRPGSNTPQLDSTPIIPQNELDSGLSFKRPRRSASISNLPIKISNKELPAEVPQSFPAGGSSSDPNMISRFNQQARTPPSTPGKKRPNVLSRDASTKTGISTYTIPIGLGVIDGSPTIGKAPFDVPTPTPTNGSLTPRPLRPQTPPPPMKANMNAREDHVMTWDSYGAGNISGIGPSNSTGSERTRRQREIEQGIKARELNAERKAELDKDKEREAERWSERNGLGKREVWMTPKDGRGESGMDSVPETPLSAYRESWMERDSWIRR